MTKELAEAARKLAQADLQCAVAEGRADIQAGLARRLYWRKLAEGDVRGIVMPLDDAIRYLRIAGWSLGDIGRQIGKGKSYVQQRLLRIAAREEIADGD